MLAIPDSERKAIAKTGRRWENHFIQHTIGHVDCVACQELGTRLMIAELDIASVPFPEACDRWLKWRESYRRKGTVNNYRSHLVALEVFFSKLTLETIQPGHLRCYQDERLKNHKNQWNRPAGPSYINHELNTLKQMLDIAGQWDRIAKYYNPLMLPKKRPQRVMTEDEENILFEAASKNTGCYLAYLVASISNNTTATGVELRSLRLRHLRLEGPEPKVEIPHEMVKNEYRAREIPLNETALKQFRRALQRAHLLGCLDPDDYLFPKRITAPSRRYPLGEYDRSQPASASWLRKQWEELRRASGLKWVRPHDLRHQAVTRMLEAGVNEDAVKSVAGHVSQDILRRYSHQRYAAKRAAVDILNARSAPVHLLPTRRRNPARHYSL